MQEKSYFGAIFLTLPPSPSRGWVVDEGIRDTRSRTPSSMGEVEYDAHKWVVEPGKFVMHIASSSADIHAALPYVVAEAMTL